MHTARSILFTFSLCLLASAAAAQSAPVYKWVDDNGVTHYGSQPPSGSNFKATGVRANKTNKQALQARMSSDADMRAAEQTRKDFEKEEAANAESTRQEVEKERTANCEKAREQLETYDTSPRLYRPLPNGDREYLSDDELDAERANARRQVREWCE